MFGIIMDTITDTVDTTISATEKAFRLEAPTQREILSLAEIGFTAYAIVDATGVSIDVVEALIEKDG